MTVRGLLGRIMMAATLVVAPSAAQAAIPCYDVMTYNIRLDLPSDGENAWPYRSDVLTQQIAYYEPDLLGLQEVLLHQKHALERSLPAYRFVGVARDDGAEQGEFSPIAYRDEQFRLIASGTFWLSPTPDMPSKGWDAAYPRIATWARFQDRTMKDRVLVLNTHFDHVGTVARLESARLIRDWINANKSKQDRVILMGDLNSTPDSQPYAAIIAPQIGAFVMRDTIALSKTPHFGPLGTFNAFDIEHDQGSPIDHIFVGDQINVTRHATLAHHDKGRLASDHYPVLANICMVNKR